MAKFSTPLRTSMLDTAPFSTLMDNCELRIFGGAVPATADAAETGTLLATLRGGGTGPLSFGTASAAMIAKDAAQTWMTSSITATGTATHFRLVTVADAGTSAPAARVQGTVAKVGADMNLGNLVFTTGLPWTLNYFEVAFPTL